MDKLDNLSSMDVSSKPEDFPGVYCATGKATCGDIDPDQICQCPTCDIFKENKLDKGKPGGYFYADGKAQ